MTGRIVICFMAAMLVVGCSAPPLTLYTLGTPAAAPETLLLGKKPVVIAVARVTVADELDTEDIVVRDGNMLKRSRSGRWGSRLSMGITDRLTQRLAERWPNVLVTDRPLSDTPTDRVLVNIGRLDVTTAGIATLDADWLVVAHDPTSPTVRDRGHFSAAGPVATDQNVVTLMGTVVDKLAAAIDIGRH